MPRRPPGARGLIGLLEGQGQQVRLEPATEKDLFPSYEVVKAEYLAVDGAKISRNRLLQAHYHQAGEHMDFDGKQAVLDPWSHAENRAAGIKKLRAANGGDGFVPKELLSTGRPKKFRFNIAGFADEGSVDGSSDDESNGEAVSGDVSESDLAGGDDYAENHYENEDREDELIDGRMGDDFNAFS